MKREIGYAIVFLIIGIIVGLIIGNIISEISSNSTKVSRFQYDSSQNELKNLQNRFDKLTETESCLSSMIDDSYMDINGCLGKSCPINSLDDRMGINLDSCKNCFSNLSNYIWNNKNNCWDK